MTHRADRNPLEPILDVHNPKTNKSHRIWLFENQYGVSAVRQPDVRGSDGNTWSVAVIKITNFDTFEYEVDYDNPLCKEQGDLFQYVPEDQLHAIVLLASKMNAPSFN